MREFIWSVSPKRKLTIQQRAYIAAKLIGDIMVTSTERHEETNIKPLPKSLNEMLAMRKNQSMKVLHDEVETIHKFLFESDESYWHMIEAVYPSQTIEGSIFADDILAAMKIRETAKELNNNYVAKQKLETLRRSLHVVLRRYGLSRKERREWKAPEQSQDSES